MPLFKPKSKSKDMPMSKEGAKDLAMARNIQVSNKKKKMSEGGKVSFGHEVADKGGPGREISSLRKNPDPKLMSEGGSVADQIRAKRSKSLDFNEDSGGMTTTTYDMRKDDNMDAIKKENYADGGMIDEDGHGEDADTALLEELNEHAAMEDLSDSGDIHQPMDSNEHGHAMEDQHDMISAIRRKLAAKRGM